MAEAIQKLSWKSTDECERLSETTLVRLEEGRKPYVSLEGMRILQRLLAPQNPKIGSVKVENLVDSAVIKKIEDSGFFEKMAAEYGK